MQALGLRTLRPLVTLVALIAGMVAAVYIDGNGDRAEAMVHQLAGGARYCFGQGGCDEPN